MDANNVKADNGNIVNQSIDVRLLPKIDSPADLRRLSQEQLPQVCAEIREFLINSLADNPGHFASSMGAVVLTVALHYVFDTPYDRIVWDVGHQAYGHKLLTGKTKRKTRKRMVHTPYYV